METELLLTKSPLALMAAMDAPVGESLACGDDKQPRRRRVLFYSGATVDRFNPWTGEVYDLAFSMEGADLSRLANAPVLNGHSSSSAADVIGVVELAERTGQGYEATLRISEADDVTPVWQRIEEGTLRNVSMGVEILDLTIDPQSTGQRKKYIAQAWKPFEISVVPLGADPNAQFLSAGHRLAAATSAASGAERKRALHELALRDRRWRVLGRI